MDELLQCEDHVCHDPRWSLVSPTHREPVCIACLLQLLQDTEILLLKKKIILSEFLGLLCQQFPDIFNLLHGDQPVQCHIVLTLLDLTESDDKTFVSMVMEACLKLVLQLKSESLVHCILERISKECCHRNKLQQCQPYLILLGRLLNDIPGLAEKLVHEHVDLLRELGNSLLCPDEETVSALFYLMIFVFHEDLQAYLPPKLFHQVHHSLIAFLARSESQELLINLLGLLQRNLINEEFTGALLSLSLDGASLLTGLKKLLLSKNDVLQMSGVQSCSLILSKTSQRNHAVKLLEADLAEILFEMLNRNDEQQVERVFRCLGMLAQIEEFFSRCHTVYGITSVLRAVNHVSERKNSAPLREGIQLLADILQRQPLSIPLFSNPSDVKSCLVTIATSMKKPDRQVVLLSLQAFKAFLSMNHLGSPVPFTEIGKTLKMAGVKTGEITKQKHHTSTTKRSASTRQCQEKPKDTSLIAINRFLHCINNAARVVEHCQNDPTTCEETFCPPHISDSNSLSDFILHLLRCTDEYCIPAIMSKWETFSSSGEIILYFSTLHQLHTVSGTKMLPLFSKLLSAGFITSALENKGSHRYDQSYQKQINESLVDLLVSISIEMSPCLVDRTMLANIVRDGLQHLNGNSLKDCCQFIQEDGTPMSNCYVCIKMIYLSLKHEDICLPPDDIQSILISSLNLFPDLSEWPPLTIAYITYLSAWCYRFTDFDISLQCKSGFQSMLKWFSSNPLSIWYTDPQLQFHWCFSSQDLARFWGPVVLEHYLTESWHLPVDTDPDNPTDIITVTDPQTQLFCTNMRNALFRDAVQDLLLRCTSEAVLNKLTQCITVSLSEEKNNEDLFLWVSKSLPNTLQSIFLNKDNIKYNSVVALLRILLVIKDSGVTDYDDLKIIYHLINQLTKTPPVLPDVQEICLLYLSCSLQSNSTNKTVSSLLLQREDFLNLLERLANQSQFSTSLSMSLNIIPKLMLACDKTTQSAGRLVINVDKLIDMLNTNNPVERVCVLRLLSVVFLKNCQCGLVTLHRENSSQTFTLRINRVIWIYCQQSIQQDCVELREQAINCMYNMVHYLMKVNTTQGVKLLSQPWNRALIDFIMEEFDGISLRNDTILLLNTLMSHKVGRAMIDDGYMSRLHEHLLTVTEHNDMNTNKLKDSIAMYMDQAKKLKEKR